jgi:NitT/TauT family transport system substrate-binding protein
LTKRLTERRQWLAMGAAAISACGRQEKATPVRTLRAGMGQTLAAAATVGLAEELGYFRDAGLQLETTVTNSGAALIPSLVSGKLDLYVGSLSPALLTPAALGAGVRVVMARDAVKPGCSTWGSIYGLKSSFPGGMKDLRELKGKRIAFSNRGSLTEYGLELIAAAGGLGPTEVEGVILRPSEGLGALAAGKIDGVYMMSYAPSAKGPLAEKAALFPGLERALPGFQYSFILFGAALRGPERKTGQAFLRAFMKGTREFAAGKSPKNFDELAEKSGLDPAASRSSCRDAAAPGGVVNVEQIQKYADWVLRKKYIDAAVRAEDVVDSAMVGEASA